jgi:hypothetical protein
MVVHLSLRGEPGKRGLMFVSYYGRSRAFIANYRSWKVYHTDGIIAEIATSLISHETLHLTLNRFSLAASADLDNMFGRSNSWELYPHGLGDLDRSTINSAGSRKNAAKKLKKAKWKKDSSGLRRTSQMNT